MTSPVTGFMVKIPMKINRLMQVVFVSGLCATMPAFASSSLSGQDLSPLCGGDADEDDDKDEEDEDGETRLCGGDSEDEDDDKDEDEDGETRLCGGDSDEDDGDDDDGEDDTETLRP